MVQATVTLDDITSKEPVTVAQDPDQYWIKPIDYDVDELNVELLKREIDTSESFRRTPHPNVCQYHGVVLNKKDYIVGLAFERYEMDLHDLVKQGHKFSAEKCLADIEAGIKHLHSIGYVHCDVKPANIFVAPSRDHFVLGDFDSCHETDKHLEFKAGTRGWSTKDFEYAKVENDFYGLSLIRTWLEKKGWGSPVEGSSPPVTDTFLDYGNNSTWVNIL